MYPVVIINWVQYLGPPGPFSFPDSRDLLSEPPGPFPFPDSRDLLEVLVDLQSVSGRRSTETLGWSRRPENKHEQHDQLHDQEEE